MKKIICLSIIIILIVPIICMDNNQKIFLEAIEKGDFATIKSLMSKVNVNMQDAKGNTPLMVAVAANKPQIVEFLIAQGADVNQINNKMKSAADFHDATALNIAIFNKNLEMVKLLIEKGANVNQELRFEWAPSKYFKGTPLINAVENSTSEIVEYLLQKGANPNIPDHVDETPLYYANENSDLEKIRLLIKYGADVNYKMHLPSHAGANDRTVLMWAALKGKVAIVQELIKLGANSFLKDSEGHDSLVLASIGLEYAVIAARAGEKFTKTMNFLMPIHLSEAINKGELQTVEYLLEKIRHIDQLTIVKTAYDLARDEFEKTTGEEKERYKKIMDLIGVKEKEIGEMSTITLLSQLISALQKLTNTLTMISKMLLAK